MPGPQLRPNNKIKPVGCLANGVTVTIQYEFFVEFNWTIEPCTGERGERPPIDFSRCANDNIQWVAS